MTDFDAFRVLRNWGNRVVRSTPDQIDALIDAMTRSLPAGWTRDRDREAEYVARGGAHPGSVRFLWEPRPGVTTNLWLLRTQPTELQGGVVESTDRPKYYLDSAEAAKRFEDDILRPTAKATGVALGLKQPGPRSQIASPAFRALQVFLDTGERTWPLTEDGARKWRQFMIAAYLSDTLIDGDEFRGWLVSLGWGADDAAALVDRFISDARLLSEFKDELQPA